MRDLKARLEPRIQELRGKYERFLPAAFFIFGLVFDIATTDRIDHWLTLIQQAVYLVIIGSLLVFEVLETRGPLPLPEWLRKAWKYRDEATHFLFGSLLSTFVIFYFKSASILNSFLFLTVIAVLLVLNELERFKSLGLLIRFALYSLCLISYFAYLVPILLGFVGLIPFVLAFALSALVFWGLFKLLLAKTVDRTLLLERIIKPAAAVQAVILVLYVFQLIPPVPVSLKYIGIYHKVEKRDGRFALDYERPWWKFWQNGAQTFHARPGDKIYCFVQIFSPTGFKDQVKIRWLYKDKRGWQSWDAIPLDISGGREEGF
ncbi:MAG TPA: DUF2914 domain-containing protein, partial [Bdellovibrionales bacterium]|nr:DUF2914 domain-containing protein [Bdellovibrionales bacterium]